MINRLSRRAFVVLGTSALLGLATSPAYAQSKFKWEGEELYYQVEISGAQAARASIRAGKLKRSKGVSYIPLSGKAITYGFFAKSYPLNDQADTFVDPTSIRPLRANKHLRENGKDKRYVVNYEPGKLSAHVDRRVKKGKGKSRKFTQPVPTKIYDGLSWLYAIRAQPLKKGDKYTMYVYDGWKLSRLHITVVGNDKVWTPLQEFDTVKVDVEREVVRSFWRKNRKTKSKTVSYRTKKKKHYVFTLHLTDNADKVPVRLFMTSKMGDSDFRLVKFVPGGQSSMKAMTAKG
jgi:hypothetical protein